jgi:hypothetical protein
LVANGTLIIPGIELLEVKLAAGWLRGPEPKVIGGRSVESGNRDIVGDSLDNLASFPNILNLSIIVARSTSAE